jgi:hypothetical protein
LYGASGPPRRERRRRAPSETPAQVERAFYIGNLGIGAVSQISPFEAGFGLGNLPRGGSLHEIEGELPPTRPSPTARVAPFEGLLHPQATLERPPNPPLGARAGRRATWRGKTWPSRPLK